MYQLLYIYLTAKKIFFQEYNAKLSDFGLAKDAPDEGKTHVSTRVMGTYGYAAPEYVMTGEFSVWISVLLLYHVGDPSEREHENNHCEI